MKLQFWGVRGSIPSAGASTVRYGGNTTCVELRTPSGDLLIIDGGTGIYPLGRTLMKEFSDSPLCIHLFLTHLHWDHIQGLPSFAPLFSRKTTVTVYSRNETATRKALQLLFSSPYFPLPLHRIAVRIRFAPLPTSPVQVGGVRISAFRLHHPQVAHGFRIEANGGSAVLALDREHGHPELDRVLLRNAEGADVLIHDAQYTPIEYRQKRGWGHSTWSVAAKLAQQCQVGRLVLFHHDPSRSDEQLDEIADCTRSIFSASGAAAEGARIDWNSGAPVLQQPRDWPARKRRR